jgi:hypothetical protein
MAFSALVIGCVIAGTAYLLIISGPVEEEPEAPAAKVVKKQTRARFQADQTTYNFGRMDQEQESEHTFKIKNVGQDQLVIQLAKASCGCSSVKLKNIVWSGGEQEVPATLAYLAPGEEADMVIGWKTEHRSGPFSISVTLNTSDPTNHEVLFRIEGQIVPEVQLSEHRLVINDVSNDRETTAKFYVFSTVREDLTVKPVSTSNPLVSLEFEPMEPELMKQLEYKSGYVGWVRIAPGMPLGPFQERVVLSTNVPTRPKLTVDLVGQVRGPVFLTPWKRLSFKMVRISEGATLKLFVKIAGEKDYTAKVTKVEPQFLQVQWKKIKGGKNRFQLIATVPKGAPGGNFRGMIEIETDHPTAKVIKIPVRGQVVR